MLLYTSGAHGITLGGAGGGNLVVNNLVYDHAESGIRVIGTAGSTSIRNNTVYGNRDGLRVDSPAVIRNNVAAGNAGVGLLDLGGPGTVNDYNCIHGNGDADYEGANGLGAHSVRADPPFVNPQGVDVHLQSLTGSYHGGAWTADPSGVSDMCISNDPSCTAWQPYAASRAWTLTSGDGSKTVYVPGRFCSRGPGSGMPRAAWPPRTPTSSS